MLLIIDKSMKRGRTVSEMTHIMGYLSFSTTPYDFFNEVSPLYSSILYIEPNELDEDREYFEKVRKFSLGAPVFAFTSNNNLNFDDKYFDKTFIQSTYDPSILNQIVAFAECEGKRPIGKYCGYGIQASANMIKPEFFDEKLDLTKTQTMILRFLLRAFPTPMSPQSIVKYAIRPGKHLEISSIKTHISLLNKRGRQSANKNLIEFMNNSGYVINVPKERSEFIDYENLI